jgi:hypothetical protein
MKQNRAYSFLAIFTILALVFCAIPTGTVKAASLCVNTDGSDGCYSSIQSAVDAAAAGDTITVAAGTYPLTNTVVINKALTISGPGGGGAILQATNSTVVGVFEINASNVTISNFTMTHTALPAFGVLTPYETSNSFIKVPATGLGLTNISILNNTIYVPAQSGAMSTWNGIGIYVNKVAVTGMTISGNTIYNTRSGIVIYYNNAVTFSNNVIYNTKGGIMNYTGSQADANNRVMTNNSWNDVHNEWDIVWNSGGGPYDPDYKQQVLQVSQVNNDAYVVSQMTATYTKTTLTGNRSHVFADATNGTTTLNWSNGSMTTPYAKIQDAVNAVVPGGKVIVAAGTYDEKVSVSKALTLQGAGADTTNIHPTASGDYSLISVTNPGGDVTIDGFNFVLPVFANYGTAVSVNDASGAIDANTVTISNNVVTGSNDGNTGTDFGFYAQGNHAKFVVTNNTFNYTGSNAIMMEQHLGSSLITGNTIRITNDVYYDPIFSMIYGNNDVTTPQIISGNTIYLAHSGAGYSTAITFNAAPPYAPSPKAGHYRDIQILNNTIYTGGDDARGIAISDRSTADDSQITGVVISGNTVVGVNKTDTNTRGILINGDVQGALITNNDIRNVLSGIVISAGAGNSVNPSGTTVEKNRLVNNGAGVSFSGTSDNLDASPNWWGSLVGPAAGAISGQVTYTPWCLNEACTLFGPVDGKLTLPDGVSADVIQQAIDNAPANTIIVIPAGTYNFSGGYHVDNPHLTLFLKNGVIIQNSSPCFDVNASYTTITTESAGGAKCVPTNGANGINVANDLQNIIIQGLEIDGTAQTTGDGIHFAGAITDVQVLDNYIHALGGNGLAFAATPAGVVDIQGNLFKANTGFGVSTPADVDVSYNSWGSKDGAVAGDGVSSAITSIPPYTHVEISMTSGSSTPWDNQVLPGYSITYTVKGNFQSVLAADFAVAFPTNLTLNSTTLGSYFTTPAPGHSVIETSGNTIHFAGTANTAVSGDDLVLYTATFTAGTAGNGALQFATTSDKFAMLPAEGPSTNVYASALSDGVVNVISALPTLNTTGLAVPFTVGHAQEFSLVINNPLAGVAYAHPQVRFTLPSDADLEYYNGSTWVAVSTGTLDLAALAASGTDVTVPLRVTFATPASVAFSASLYDTVEVTPDALLATASHAIDVRATASLTGTFSMQGRTTRAGVPVTLTGTLFGSLLGTSFDQISNNLVITGVISYDTYTLTTNQARYLNVTADLAKTVAGNKGTMNALELKGGNAVWTNNVIDVYDASRVGTDWGVTGDGDVNFSGKVDIFDLAIVGGNYNLTSATAYGTWVP